MYFEEISTEGNVEPLQIKLKQSIVYLLEQGNFNQSEYLNLTAIEIFAIILREFQLYYQSIGTRFERLFFLPWMHPFRRDETRLSDRLYEFYFRFVPVNKQWELLTVMEKIVQNSSGLDQRIIWDIRSVIQDIK